MKLMTLDCDLSVKCKDNLKHWTEMIKQKLDLAALGGAIWISHVQHSKDLQSLEKTERKKGKLVVSSVLQ